MFDLNRQDQRTVCIYDISHLFQACIHLLKTHSTMQNFHWHVVNKRDPILSFVAHQWAKAKSSFILALKHSLPPISL